MVFEPARELSFSEDWESDGGPVPSFITIRLTPLYEGCHVELFHHGFERLGIAEEVDETEGPVERRRRASPLRLQCGIARRV